MMGKLKLLGLLVTGIGFAATMAGNVIADKKQEEIIQKEVAKQLKSTEEEES